jgi:hypothetical protein
MTAATLEEMETAANRLSRLHHIPRDTISISADELTVTLTRVEDYERIRAEIPHLNPFATHPNRWHGWAGEYMVTILLAVPAGIIPATRGAA